MEISPNHQTVMPYLILPGAAKFMTFVQQVFNARQLYYQTDEAGAVRHAEVNIDGSTIMFADSTEAWAPQTAGLYVYVSDADEIYHKALANGAVSVMEPANQSYGRSSGVQDPCGNTWWITSVIA